MSVDLSLAPVSSLQDIPTMKYYSCSILMNSKTEIYYFYIYLHCIMTDM